jgi:hypothetical protein
MKMSNCCATRKQYCRYCAYCCAQDDSIVWCEKKQKMLSSSTAKTPNNCDTFLFNELDVFNIEHKYKPVKRMDYSKQLNLF